MKQLIDLRSWLMPALFGVWLVCTGATQAALLLVTASAAFAQSGATAGDEEYEAEPNPYESLIRFITTDDYPPFNYLDEEGTLTGFNVDIARAICLELDVTCDVQSQPWPVLLQALQRGTADAAIASIAISAPTIALADFTDRYYFTPARFVARRDWRGVVSPEGLESLRIGVRKGTAHEAYLQAHFRDSVIDAFETDDALREALRAEKVELIFGDGIGLMFWLNGTLSESCCAFFGGPYSDPTYFGDGIGVAVRKGDGELKTLINRAIRKLRSSGRLEEIYLRYFPLQVY